MNTPHLAGERRTGMAMSGIVALAGTLTTVLWPGPARGAWLLAAPIAGVLFVATVLFRRRASRHLDTAVLLMSVALALTAMAIANNNMARSGVHFEPFIGCKVGALAIALLAPADLWVGVLGIGATAVVPIVEFFSWPTAIRLALPRPEPWTTLLYSLVAIIVLVYRRHQVKTQRHLVALQTRAESSERYMRKFLAVRDLANSPLQALEYTTAFLQARYPDSSVQFSRLQRSLSRLRQLSVALRRYQPRKWDPADARFDALEVLERLEEGEHEPGGPN